MRWKSCAAIYFCLVALVRSLVCQELVPTPTVGCGPDIARSHSQCQP
jgi:hypothetical protein